VEKSGPVILKGQHRAGFAKDGNKLGKKIMSGPIWKKMVPSEKKKVGMILKNTLEEKETFHEKSDLGKTKLANQRRLRATCQCHAAGGRGRKQNQSLVQQKKAKSRKTESAKSRAAHPCDSLSTRPKGGNQ